MQEWSAIEQARAYLAAQRAARSGQEEADNQFGQMHRDLAGFLENNPETRVTDWRWRGLFTVFGLFTLPVVYLLYKTPKIYDFADRRRYQTLVNGDGEPIGVHLESQNARPLRNGWPVDLVVNGLPNHLSLHPNFGLIVEGHPGESHLPHHLRAANQEDIPLFRPIINAIIRTV